MSGELLWIAVPCGFSPSGERNLCVLVVPRLDGAKKRVGEEGLAQWPPPNFASALLEVELGRDVDDRDPIVHRVHPRTVADPTLWSEMFGEVEVEAPRADVVRELWEEKTTEDAAAVEAIYREAAAKLVRPDGGAELAGLLMQRLAPRDATRPRRDAHAVQRDPPPPRRDFHHIVSLLREHPHVMRALGLIFDVSFPADPRRLAGSVVRVRWDAAPKGVPTIRSRWTAYDEARFRPVAGPGSELHPTGGMVELARLEKPGKRVWRLHTVDMDQALDRLRDATMGEAAPLRSLPALRTTGISLLCAGRAERVRAQQGQSIRRKEPDREKRALTADDLLLGYRVDVRQADGAWRSLCGRLATYRVNGRVVGAETQEEGHVKPYVGVDPGDLTMRVDEVVTRWAGGGLATLDDQGEAGGSRRKRSDLPFDLQFGFRPVKGSLPRLRFGRQYQLRLRTADVVGAGDALSTPSPDGSESEWITFLRHEPVLPPDLRLPDGLAPDATGPGASLTNLVIRTAEGIPDAPADSVRVLAPPGGTLELIERHGRLDADLAAARRAFEKGEAPDPASGGVVAWLRPEPGGATEDLEPAPWRSATGAGPDEDPWPDLAEKRLRLTARRGAEPTLTYEAERDEMVVRLSPAEYVTLELSSLPRPGEALKLSVAAWISATSDPDHARTRLELGRHPMSTPPRAVTLVHAVRRPLEAPRGELAIERQEGSTYADVRAEIEPGAGPRLRIHVPSTATLDVAASWAPVEDKADPPVCDRPVGQILVPRGAKSLELLRQEFGDTKHRMVTYALTATSRFQEHFPADAAAAFQQTGMTAAVSIPSSARPPPPIVRSAVPGFVWTESRPDPATTVRTRLGNRVRVEMEGPWFATGDGERLAVLAPAEASGAAPASNPEGAFTECARDPIWMTPPATRFPMATGPQATVALPGGGNVTAVTHGAWELGDRWYADVVLPAVGSYGALIRLALARYQPNSLAGLELSPVVTTDFVPLLPDRTWTVGVVSWDRAEVVLEGLAPWGPRPNRVDVVLEAGVSRNPDGPLNLAIPVGPSGAEVLADDDPATAWTLVDSVRGALGETLAVALPRGAGPLRLRVREVEVVGTSPSTELGSVAELSERVVFTDVLRVR